nr:MAG TPA: hypothetical protein [Caudoviricetes sp.]
MAPPTTTTIGGQTEDAPPHEQHRRALTHTHSAMNSTQHDMT